MSTAWSPLVIVGAPRSGTNMLRDALSSLDGIATWPCDEINYVWRHGNVRYPSDEFSPEMASPRVQNYVRRQFRWVSRRYAARTVLEKTCANSLRVEFVDRVLPDARYIFIRRNGHDVVGSAMQRWRADIDVLYLLRKTRFVPTMDLPYYLARFLRNQAFRLFSGRERLAFWGPQLNDMPQILATHSLEEVCAIQWARCVDASLQASATLEQDRWMEVAYEDLVTRPSEALSAVANFAAVKSTPEEIARIASGFSRSSVGKGQAQLGSIAETLEPLMGATMRRLGYA